MWSVGERPERFRFLIRDRDQRCTDSVDDVFRSERMEIIRTPFRAPQANGVAERFVRTARSECLDWLLILNQQQLETAVGVFVDHYNGHRPHRARASLRRARHAQRWCLRRGLARLESNVAIVSVV